VWRRRDDTTCWLLVDEQRKAVRHVCGGIGHGQHLQVWDAEDAQAVLAGGRRSKSPVWYLPGLDLDD
jgi:hypothetical protein